MIRKRFSAVRIVRDSAPQTNAEDRVIVYLNHAGWWDPLIGVAVAERFFSNRTFYAPIDAEAVEKYSVMKRLGFFPVDQNSAAGLKSFLQTMSALLKRNDTVVMVTPHGQFVDVRDNQPFQPGLGHVIAGIDQVTIIPMAVEYTFWDESNPEVLIGFGDTIRKQSERSPDSKQQWTARLEQTLQQTQDGLRDLAVSRQPDRFETIIGGRVGEGGIYDFARRVRSALTGSKFEPSHSQNLGDQADEVQHINGSAK